MRQLLTGEISSFSMEKRYVRKDGVDAWARVHVSLARDEDNNRNTTLPSWRTSPTAGSRRPPCARAKSASGTWPTPRR